MELRIIATIIRRSIPTLILIGVTVLVLGEAYMRIPWIPQRLEYDIDPEIGGIVRPNQRGYIWMANMSFQSPPITVNGEGYRGRETHWDRPAILGLGSSEAWGAGVADDEVWSAVLEHHARTTGRQSELQVVNAGNPGFGPYRQSVILQRILDSHDVEGVIVRVSHGDRYFQPRTPEQLSRQLDSARVRKKLRSVTKFIPFLVNKAEAQLPAIQAAFRPWWFPQTRSADAAPDPEQFWNAQYFWWVAMVDLAREREIPILFMIQDPFDLADNDHVERGLREACAGVNGCEVYRMTSSDYGLDPAGGDIRAQFRQTMTLVRDAHANAAQHATIADALWKYVSANRWPADP